MLTIKELAARVGGLSTPSKMPGFAYGIPAWECKIGSTLRKRPGSVCSKCYALKGMYGFPIVKSAQVRRLEALSRSDWVENMIALLRAKYRNRKGRDRVFRWHDSGDIQSLGHLEKIVAIAKNLPSIKFWLPTKERRIVKDFLSRNSFPANLVVRVSAPMIGQRAKSLPGTHSSTVNFSGGRQCPARHQGGECKNCRACWDKRIPSVNYPQH